jgi:hypothetical protein
MAPTQTAPKSQQELLLVRGLPGTGKTQVAHTYAATHAHVEADSFFADYQGYLTINRQRIFHAQLWCQAWTLYFLERGHSVVVANTFVEQWTFVPYQAFAQYACVPLRVLELPMEPTRLHRNRQGGLQSWVAHLKKRWETSPIPSVSVVQPQESIHPRELSYQCQPGLCTEGTDAQALSYVHAYMQDVLDTNTQDWSRFYNTHGE